MGCNFYRFGFISVAGRDSVVALLPLLPAFIVAVVVAVVVVVLLLAFVVVVVVIVVIVLLLLLLLLLPDITFTVD